MKILVINPGGSSTKIAVFENETALFKTNINHSLEELSVFSTVFDQLEYRKQLIVKTLEKEGHPLTSLAAVVGRGGLMKEIPGGTYAVSEAMVSDLKSAIRGEHASNLGAPLAKGFADLLGIPAFVVDPVSVDEFEDVSRITGIADLSYSSWLHALNHKAVARQVAEGLGKKYEECNLIVAHLGSGISIVPHAHGKMVDGSGGRSNGPFAADRSGGLPAYPLIELCFSGKYTRKELVDKVSSVGGFCDYLGTKDLMEVENRIAKGDPRAKLIMDAFIYQISKDIAMYGATLYGKVDAIAITGGIANSKMVINGIVERVGYLAPVKIVAGEMEMEAMAKGALRVLSGEVPAKIY